MKADDRSRERECVRQRQRKGGGVFGMRMKLGRKEGKEGMAEEGREGRDGRTVEESSDYSCTSPQRSLDVI